MLISFSFFNHGFFVAGLMKLVISVDDHWKKKSSSGLSSQLTRQDSDGEMLQESNGVLRAVVVVVQGALAEQVKNVAAVGWRRICRGGRWRGRSLPLKKSSSAEEVVGCLSVEERDIFWNSNSLDCGEEMSSISMKSSSSAISFNARPLVISIHQTEKIAVSVVCVCV